MARCALPGDARLHLRRAARPGNRGALPIPSVAFSALNPGKSAHTILDFLTETGEERLIAVGHLPWIGQLAAQLRGEHGYFPFNHGMILVFDGDAASGWQMTASFQPQPVSG